MCSDICFLRLPAFKEFFDLDKAVGGEEPYLFCSYSTLDGVGINAPFSSSDSLTAVLSLKGAETSVSYTESACRAGAHFLTHYFL